MVAAAVMVLGGGGGQAHFSGAGVCRARHTAAATKASNVDFARRRRAFIGNLLMLVFTPGKPVFNVSIERERKSLGMDAAACYVLDKGWGPARLKAPVRDWPGRTQDNRIAINSGSVFAGTDPQSPTASLPYRTKASEQSSVEAEP